LLDIKALRREAKAAGVYKRHELRSWLKFLFLLTVAAGIIAVQVASPLWLAALLVPVCAWFITGAVMIGHEGGHKALSKNNTRNSLMLHLAFPIMGGLGAQYWKYKHNVKHHAYPNVQGEDPDILLWPMACTSEVHAKAGPAQKFFQRHLQGAAFWPLTMLLPVSMRGSSFIYLYRRIKERGMDREVAVDLFSLSMHYILWLVVPSFFVGFGAAFAFWFVTWAFVGLYLAMIFAPAHMGLPIYRDHHDPWLLQLETTRNLRLPKIISFFFIGLDYQVEHHLFPRVPHQNMALARDVVRAWTARHGIQHLEVSYWEGFKDVTRFMNDGWKFEILSPTAEEEPATELPKAA
jgi:fatty acid desaturase